MPDRLRVVAKWSQNVRQKNPHTRWGGCAKQNGFDYKFFSLNLPHPKTISIARLSSLPSCLLCDGPCYSAARPRSDPNVICRGDPVDIVSVSGDFPPLCAPMSLTVYPLAAPSSASVARLLCSSPHPSEVLVSQGSLSLNASLRLPSRPNKAHKRVFRGLPETACHKSIDWCVKFRI